MLIKRLKRIHEVDLEIEYNDEYGQYNIFRLGEILTISDSLNAWCGFHPITTPRRIDYFDTIDIFFDYSAETYDRIELVGNKFTLDINDGPGESARPYYVH